MAINTNVGSLAANKQLSQTSLDIQDSMKRLSTGKRINSGGDDAAGVAITSNVDRQLLGNEQGLRNSVDGLSMIEMADGVLDEVVSLVTRARTLSIYAATGTLSARDRSALDLEYQQLVGAGGEASRLFGSVEFNGLSLVDDGNGALLFQVGWEGGDTVLVNTREYASGGVDDQFGAIGDLTTKANATSELIKLDSAIDEFSNYRAELGSSANRFERIVTGLDSTNLSNRIVRGGVEDADFARETTILAKAQVLQQSGMGMIKRAEQSTQNVMQLLNQLA